MQKIEIYAELFARWIILLLSIPFTILFFILYSLGFIAEYFFSWLWKFTQGTRDLLYKTTVNEPEKSPT